MSAGPVIIQLNSGDRVDRFTVFKKLGEGTFGAVYAVRDDSGAEHALKAELATEKIPVSDGDRLEKRAIAAAETGALCDAEADGEEGKAHGNVDWLVTFSGVVKHLDYSRQGTSSELQLHRHEVPRQIAPGCEEDWAQRSSDSRHGHRCLHPVSRGTRGTPLVRLLASGRQAGKLLSGTVRVWRTAQDIRSGFRTLSSVRR